MTSQTFHFTVSNTQLFSCYWQPKTAPKAVVILVHGMGEHIGRYEKSVVPHLVKNGYAVVGYDQFGHGKTKGKRGHNPNFDAVLTCVTEVIIKSKKLFNGVSLFLYGHSMGGNVVLNYVLRRKHPFKGLIATSPFLQLAFQPPALKLAIGKLLYKIAPGLTMSNELDANDISRIPEEVLAYVNDPLVHDKISPNYSIKFIETGQWALYHAQDLQVNTLLLHGTGDKIIDHKATKEFADKSNGKASIKLFEGAYHELHNDLCREKMLVTITDWLNSQLKDKVE
jgi:alpha-beta hydrolase superfamily lysophospholipase